MYLLDMVFYWAKVEPRRIAVIQPELITTYQALAEAIKSSAARLKQLQLDRREPLGLSIANPSYLLAATFAALGSGYSVALVRPALLPLLQAIGVRNLIYDTQGMVLSGGRNVRFDNSWVSGATGVSNGTFEPLADARTAVIFFTSGTTGIPKKLIQPLSAMEKLLAYPMTCASRPGDRILLMAGLTTTLGFNRLCEVLSVGKTSCFALDNDTALSMIEIHHIDVAVTSAVQAAQLAATKRAKPGYCTGSLKEIFIGGGKIDPAAIANIRSSLCRELINQYGSTEAGVVALTPFHVLNDQAAVIPLPWAEVQVVNQAGQQLPPSAEGLIRYHTPQLAENIKRAGDEGVTGVRDGWFYPGDLGALSADGVLHFAGRTSDVINRGGVKVSGDRIEEILRKLPNVKDAAACGVPGPSGLEELWIAIVPSGPVEKDEIEQTLAKHVDVGLAPDEVFLLEELPVGELGKVQKSRLKEMLLQRKRAA